MAPLKFAFMALRTLSSNVQPPYLAIRAIQDLKNIKCIVIRCTYKTKNLKYKFDISKSHNMQIFYLQFSLVENLVKLRNVNKCQSAYRYDISIARKKFLVNQIHKFTMVKI